MVTRTDGRRELYLVEVLEYHRTYQHLLSYYRIVYDFPPIFLFFVDHLSLFCEVVYPVLHCISFIVLVSQIFFLNLWRFFLFFSS